MARFFGLVQGSRGQATRLGHQGLLTYCASHSGAIVCQAHVKDGADWVRVLRIPWRRSGGDFVVLYDGPMDMKLADTHPVRINLDCMEHHDA